MGHIAIHWNDILRDKALDVALLQEAVLLLQGPLSKRARPPISKEGGSQVG